MGTDFSGYLVKAGRALLIRYACKISTFRRVTNLAFQKWLRFISKEACQHYLNFKTGIRVYLTSADYY